MNFSGFSPHEFGRWSSLVEQDDPTALPVGLAAVARNVTFHLTSVRTRDGIQTQFQTPTQDQPVTGLASLKYQQPSGEMQVPMIFDSGGRLYVEFPAGSGTLKPVTDQSDFSATRIQSSGGTSVFKYYWDAGVSTNGTAYFLTISVKNQGTQPIFINSNFNSSGAIAPGTWQTVTLNFTGDGSNHLQFLFQANSAADSMDVLAYAPVMAKVSDRVNLIPGANQNFSGWSAVLGASVSVAQAQPGANPLVGLPLNAHLQVAAAYNRGYLAFSDLKLGQASPAVYDLFSGNLDPFSMRPVGDRWKPNTAYKVGEVVTPSGGPAGNGHTYRCTIAGTSGTNEPGTGGVPAWPTVAGNTVNEGTCLWTENTPTLSISAQPGNICTGQRYMVVLFRNRNGYITGMSEASVVGLNIGTGSRELTVSSIPAGPANTAARICAFTVAGGSTAGDYFYIPLNDSVSGIPITTTVINDNTTTSATFNFTDVYLLASTKVTSFFRKIQAPACVDIYFSESTGRMALSGAIGFPAAGWFHCKMIRKASMEIQAWCRPGRMTARGPLPGAISVA